MFSNLISSNHSRKKNPFADGRRTWQLYCTHNVEGIKKLFGNFNFLNSYKFISNNLLHCHSTKKLISIFVQRHRHDINVGEKKKFGKHLDETYGCWMKNLEAASLFVLMVVYGKLYLQIQIQTWMDRIYTIMLSEVQHNIKFNKLPPANSREIIFIFWN